MKEFDYEIALQLRVESAADMPASHAVEFEQHMERMYEEVFKAFNKIAESFSKSIQNISSALNKYKEIEVITNQLSLEVKGFNKRIAFVSLDIVGLQAIFRCELCLQSMSFARVIDLPDSSFAEIDIVSNESIPNAITEEIDSPQYNAADFEMDFRLFASNLGQLLGLEMAKRRDQ